MNRDPDAVMADTRDTCFSLSLRCRLLTKNSFTDEFLRLLALNFFLYFNFKNLNVIVIIRKTGKYDTISVT